MSHPPPTQDQQVLVVAPGGHDATLIGAALAEAGVPARLCSNVPDCCRALETTNFDLLIVAEEALKPPDASSLANWLDHQPHWSELPLLILSLEGELGPDGRRALDALNGSVTLLERPLRRQTLLSAVRVALRSRRRQYQVRDLLAALRESQQRFAAFMRHLPAAAWMKDLEGRYFYANPEAERIFSKSFSEIEGKTDEQLFPPEIARQFRENDRRVLAQGGAIETTEVLRQADGLDHYSLVSKFAVPDTDGCPASIGGVAFDITKSKQAEAALRQSQEQLAAELTAMNRLHELSTRFLRQEDLRSLLDGILDAAIAITGASKGNVQLVDAATGKLGIMVQRGFEEAFVEFFSQIRPGEAACGTAMKTRQCVIVEDITLSPIFLGQHGRSNSNSPPGCGPSPALRSSPVSGH